MQTMQGSVGMIDDKYWKTADGRLLALKDMETSHLFNTAKMLYNALAYVWGGPSFGNSPRYYADMNARAKRDPATNVMAIKALAQELASRELPKDVQNDCQFLMWHVNTVVKDLKRQVLL